MLQGWVQVDPITCCADMTHLEVGTRWAGYASTISPMVGSTSKILRPRTLWNSKQSQPNGLVGGRVDQRRPQTWSGSTRDIACVTVKCKFDFWRTKTELFADPRKRMDGATRTILESVRVENIRLSLFAGRRVVCFCYICGTARHQAGPDTIL